MPNTYKLSLIPRYLFMIACTSFLFACTSTKKVGKDFNYFQRDLDSESRIPLKELVIHDNDLLGIQINSASLNQDQAMLFNLPSYSKGYTVSMNGFIDLPVIGIIKASGLTKIELQKVIIDKLTAYIKDPIVVVRLLQFKINVLGEVGSPGTKTFESDRVTIIDALSVAGDITVGGERTNVMVIREENSQRKYYYIDMRTGALFKSPVYQLQQNDIVYVAGNEKKLKEVDTNANGQSNLRTILSTTSFLINLVLLVLRIVQN